MEVWELISPGWKLCVMQLYCRFNSKSTKQRQGLTVETEQAWLLRYTIHSYTYKNKVCEGNEEQLIKTSIGPSGVSVLRLFLPCVGHWTQQNLYINAILWNTAMFFFNFTLLLKIKHLINCSYVVWNKTFVGNFTVMTDNTIKRI